MNQFYAFVVPGGWRYLLRLLDLLLFSCSTDVTLAQSKRVTGVAKLH